MASEEVEQPTRGTLTIEELEQLLVVEDEADVRRGDLLWILDNAVWATQFRNLPASLDAHFFDSLWKILSEDPDVGTRERQALAHFQTALTRPLFKALVQDVLARPFDDLNPEECDPAKTRHDDVIQHLALPEWASRWFQLAGDSVGLRAPDLRSALVGEVLEHAFGDLESKYLGLDAKLEQAKRLTARARHVEPGRAHQLLRDSDRLLTDAAADLRKETTRIETAKQAHQAMKLAHWREAMIAMANGIKEHPSATAN